ncbi:MAG: hypothetical protein KF815_10355 [Rhodospirillales bacterium]|nr:hypothetical protein [Rhodospirillales bacterium]
MTSAIGPIPTALLAMVGPSLPNNGAGPGTGTGPAAPTPTAPATPAALPTAGAGTLAFAGSPPNPSAAATAVEPGPVVVDLSGLPDARLRPGQPQTRHERASPQAPAMPAAAAAAGGAGAASTDPAVRKLDGFAIRLLDILSREVGLSRQVGEEAGGERATSFARSVEASVQRLERDDGARPASRQESENALGEWRQAWIALPADATPSPLYLQWRERGEAARSNGLGRRFVINVRLTRLGALELDGLMNDGGDRFDLIVRSEAMLPPPVRAGVRQMFETALGILAARGGLAFEAEGQDPAAPGRCDRPPGSPGLVT